MRVLALSSRKLRLGREETETFTDSERAATSGPSLSSAGSTSSDDFKADQGTALLSFAPFQSLAWTLQVFAPALDLNPIGFSKTAEGKQALRMFGLPASEARRGDDDDGGPVALVRSRFPPTLILVSLLAGALRNRLGTPVPTALGRPRSLNNG